MADLTEYVQAAARALRDVGGPNGPAAGSTRRCPMPKREHIEALARALVPDAWDDNSDVLKSDLRRAALRAMGGRFFAAIVTDPAAQDAVLAALVEGGRLVDHRDTAVALEAENARLREGIEAMRHYCGCAWCCTGTPREQRGQGHAGCRT